MAFLNSIKKFFEEPKYLNEMAFIYAIKTKVPFSKKEKIGQDLAKIFIPYWKDVSIYYKGKKYLENVGIECLTPKFNPTNNEDIAIFADITCKAVDLFRKNKIEYKTEHKTISYIIGRKKVYTI